MFGFKKNSFEKQTLFCVRENVTLPVPLDLSAMFSTVDHDILLECLLLRLLFCEGCTCSYLEISTGGKCLGQLMIGVHEQTHMMSVLKGLQWCQLLSEQFSMLVLTSEHGWKRMLGLFSYIAIYIKCLD